MVDTFVVTQEMKDINQVTYLMHKARQGDFAQSVRDKMKETHGTPKMMEEFGKMFQEADANHDGNLSEDEFLEFRRLFTNYQAVTNGEGVTIPQELDRVAYQRMK